MSPRMELCPYCKKPFKRLKSHLPHCKKVETAGREDQKPLPIKPVLLASAKKTKRLVQDGKEPGTGVGEKYSKVTRDTPERPIELFPLQDVSVRSAGTTQAGGDSKNQIHVSRVLGSAEQNTQALPGRQEGGAPRAKPPMTPKSERRGSESAETEAALPHGPTEPSLSSLQRSYSSALAKNIQAISAHLNVDKTDPPRQKLPGKAPGTPKGGARNSPTSLSHQGPSATGPASKARATDRICHTPLDVAGSETQTRAPGPPSLHLHVDPRDEKQGPEAAGPIPRLRGGTPGGQGKAGESVAVTGAVTWVSTNGHSKKDQPGTAAPGLRSRDTGLGLSLPQSPLRGPAYRELRAGSEAAVPSLVTLAVKFLPAEKAEACPLQGDPELLTSPLSQQLGSREPSLGAWPQAKTLPGGLLALQPTQLHPLQTPTTPAARGPAVEADPKPLCGSLGLQWFPELYPAYLGLGMLPGNLRYRDLVSLKPRVVRPQGESRRSQVPLLGRSSTILRSLEPSSLAPSNLSLTSLLAAVQRGCLRCGSSMRSGVGSASMLVTGYFVLCCNWSFKHLSETLTPHPTPSQWPDLAGSVSSLGQKAAPWVGMEGSRLPWDLPPVHPVSSRSGLQVPARGFEVFLVGVGLGPHAAVLRDQTQVSPGQADAHPLPCHCPRSDVFLQRVWGPES